MSEAKLPSDAALPARAIVAQNLLAARSALDLTQQELADQSGISRATIAQLEAGLGDPRLTTLEMLAVILHVPAHFLLLDQASFRAIAELITQNESLCRSVKKPQEALGRMFSAGALTTRAKAAAIGVDSAVEAGLTGNAHRVGAAIGAARFQASGTFLGAHLAAMLEHFGRARAKTKPIDDQEFSMGEGI